MERIERNIEIERALLVCYGDWMGLRMGGMVEQDKGFNMNHAVSAHPPTTKNNSLFKI